MDKRREIRYSIIEYLDNTISKEDCILEIEVNGKIIAKSIDISMSGIGFEIIDVEQEQIETIQNNDNFFIKIYFAKEVVIIDAKKVWSAVMKENDKDVLKGGLSFSVISTEDRLKLLKYIEDIREKL
ncbi:MAG: PilZ domain-containing protein [Spirochaetota bacterium]|nr:PilZ domain-containing protein [Spirochaetota bacterium]